MNAFQCVEKNVMRICSSCWYKSLTGTKVTVVLVLLYVYDEKKGLTASAKLFNLLVSAFEKPMTCKLKKFYNCPLEITSH